MLFNKLCVTEKRTYLCKQIELVLLSIPLNKLPISTIRERLLELEARDRKRELALEAANLLLDKELARVSTFVEDKVCHSKITKAFPAIFNKMF